MLGDSPAYSNTPKKDKYPPGHLSLPRQMPQGQVYPGQTASEHVSVHLQNCPLWKTTLHGIPPLTDDDHKKMTSFNKRQHLMKGDL